MLPTSSPELFFAADQEWQFRVQFWDTPQTVLQNDLGSTGLRLDVREPASQVADWFGYASTLKAVANDTSPNTAFEAAASTSVVSDGRWPVLEAFWAAGTPSWWGTRYSGKVALKFSGTLVPAAQRAWFGNSTDVTFALAGSGWCRIDTIDGPTRNTVFAGDLSEGQFLSEGFSYSTVADLTLPVDCQVEIFYVQDGTEPWGGFVIKAIHGTRPSAANLPAAAAEAPVLSCGLVSAASVSPVTLPFIQDISVKQTKGGAATAEITIPLVNPDYHDGHGWVYTRSVSLSDPGALQLWDGGAVVTTVKRKRLIRVQVARRSTAPVWATLFTGHINDFDPDNTSTLKLHCMGLENRLVEQYDQVPDRISYMARGFRTLDYIAEGAERLNEPVYNVPAFDNWPLAWAVEELGIRSGVDPSCYREPWLAVLENGSSATVELHGTAARRFRGQTTSGAKLRLPRSVNYGNVGRSFTETLPIDDPYIFAVEPTEDNWAATRALVDKVGYECRFDANGKAVLQPAYTPSFVVNIDPADVTSGTMTEEISPAAFGANYLRATGACTVEKTVKGSRIAVVLPRKSDAFVWNFSVTRTGEVTPIVTGTVDPATNSGTNLELLYSSGVTAVGTSTTVFTLYTGDYDEYDVELSPVVPGSLAPGAAAYIDALVVYAQDPDQSILPVLSTSEAALSVSTVSQQDATRNRVTIVGRRKGTVTDSDKFTESKAPTDQEFVVESAVDVRSIVDPTASNYVGYVKQSVIYDESIGDTAFAKYLAQVFIYRQSVPQPGASVKHTLLPMLELGDPVSVHDTKYDTILPTLRQYVNEIQHNIDRNQYITTLTTDPWPEYPAYEPRTDIDLADFNNQPIVNTSASYLSISGHEIVDPTTSLINDVLDYDDTTGTIVEYANVPVAGTTTKYLALAANAPWPPVPGTFQARPTTGAGGETSETDRFVFATAPVRGSTVGGATSVFFSPAWQLMDINYSVAIQVWNSGTNEYEWQGVSGGPVSLATVVRSGNILFIPEQDVTVANESPGAFYSVTYTIRFRGFDADSPDGYVANTPYHRYFTIDNDATSATEDNSTAYRAALTWEHGTGNGVFARDGATAYNVRYRSLFPKDMSDPNGEVTEEKWSPYYDPYTSELGNVITYSWDTLAEGLYRVSIRNRDTGTIVAWLTNPTEDAKDDKLHWEYMPAAASVIRTWDGVDQLGDWNSAQSELYAQFAATVFDADESQRVGAGFYVWNREVAAGQLAQQAYIWLKQDANGNPIIGQGTYGAWYLHVESKLPDLGPVTVRDSLSVLTHLPEPTRLELKVEDHDGNNWVAPYYNANVQPNTLEGYINNEKPVRLRFRVAPRPGVLWANKESEVSVQLTREVHMRVYVGDQIVVYAGKTFEGTTHEERTIYNRRFFNDEHTLQYPDATYRKAKFLKWDDNDPYGVTEWEFRPEDFKKEFRLSGLRESVRFGDYLQLEEVPEWSGARDLASARSRLNFALMSYLFYLSAYVSDRSGRRSWGINTSFVDKSKILTNTQTATWGEDPAYMHRRSIVCRQWTNEPGWKEAQLTAFAVPATSIADKLFQHWWWQHDITATTIGTAETNWSSYILGNDDYSHSHRPAGSITNKVPLLYSTSDRQLGIYDVDETLNYMGRVPSSEVDQGNWAWEVSPAWIPCITRDLHPYFLLPPTWSPPQGIAKQGSEVDYRTTNTYITVAGARTSITYEDKTTGMTGDAGGANTWNSPVYDMSNGGTFRFWPGYAANKNETPLKDLPFTNKVLNYVRQDETLHYEELRGTFSRGKYPEGQPIKIASQSPYYINPYRYFGVNVRQTLLAPGYPLFQIVERTSPVAAGLGNDWFRMAFRGEYLWESGAFYPTNRDGQERVASYLWWRTRFPTGPKATELYYDFGAWTGWKDDIVGSTTLVCKQEGVDVSPFLTGHMPVGVSNVLPNTLELTAHLVLVPERRGDN